METLSLVTIALLVWISALVQHLNTVHSKGVGFVFTDRAHPLGDDGFAGRASRTLRNNIESAAMYVPLALLVLVHGAQTPMTALAAGIYAAARVVFTLAYWFRINKVRSLSWAAGMAGIVAMAVGVLMSGVAS